MRKRLVLLATLLALPAAAADLEPVTVAVVDRDSGAPVTAFTCNVSYEAPGHQAPPGRDAWTAVASPSGTWQVRTPPACLLKVWVKAPDYVDDDRPRREVVIASADRARRVVVRLRRGITVRGTVRDSKTGGPIAGATVTPVAGGLLSWRLDEDKRVTTDADGRYEVRGVDPAQGVSASHPDYGREVRPHDDDKPTGPRHDISLEPGKTIAARVVDPDGKPLEGVAVDNRARRAAESGKDGRLILRNPDLSDGLHFRKDGYVRVDLEYEKIDRGLSGPEGLVVVMRPSIALLGRVVAPDGRPVAAFRVAARPGRLDTSRDLVRRNVRDRDGRFRVGLSREGRTWVGVVADGSAAWEEWIELKRGGEPLQVRLSPGVAVSARVALPVALRGRVTASLVPRRGGNRDMEEAFADADTRSFLTRTATLSADGRLQLEHVRPDRYQLTIKGRGVPTTNLALDVPADGLDAGTIPIGVPAATGRIEGRVWRPESRGGGVWSFAKGHVEGILGRDGDEIEFQADEHGRFAVDGVPVGLTTVSVPYQVFDVVDAYEWSALVVEGQTTVVRVFEPGGGREFALRFAIGDGSQAQYNSGTGLAASRKVDGVTADGATPYGPRFGVELVPVPAVPLAFATPGWEDLDAGRKVVLPDVAPGTYRLRIRDWLGSTLLVGDPLFDQQVVVPAGGAGEVRIALGAGCITGKVAAPREILDRPVEVTALARGSRTPSRRVRCDDDGHFCVRYLSPGTYTLFIHDPRTGFCRVDDVAVGARVVDVGERALRPGATLRSSIRFARPARVPDAVVAVGPSGVSVRRAFSIDSTFDRLDLAGLWPGHWTISARSGDEVLAAGELDVDGTGAFPITLTAGAGPGP